MELFLVVLILVPIVNGGIYIDRLAVETNAKICNTTLAFLNKKNGDCILNATFRNFKTVTKILVYAKLMIAEDKNDRTFKRVVYSSVFDAEKMISGMQGNALLRSFSDIILKSLDFQFKYPFVPVSLCLNLHFLLNDCF